MLVSTVYYALTLSPDQLIRLYHDNSQWRLLIDVAQGTQGLDMIFAVLRMTPNSPGTVISQILSRYVILWLIFPKMHQPPELA